MRIANPGEVCSQTGKRHLMHVPHLEGLLLLLIRQHMGESWAAEPYKLFPLYTIVPHHGAPGGEHPQTLRKRTKNTHKGQKNLKLRIKQKTN